MSCSTVYDFLRKIEKGEIEIHWQPSEKPFEEWLEGRKAEAESLQKPPTAEDLETRYP